MPSFSRAAASSLAGCDGIGCFAFGKKVFVSGNDFAVFGLFVNGIRLIPSRS